MKVKLKDLKANPYRNIDSYPMQTEKIEALKKSINNTFFWNNIIARKVNDEIQIAYGHHRLEAVKQVKGLDYVVDIPVHDDMSDERILKIMIDENKKEYGVSTLVVNEDISTSKKFLENNHDIALKYCNTTNSRNSLLRNKILPTVISGFSGYSDKDVSLAIERLESTKKGGEVKKSAMEKIDSPTKSATFVKAVKEFKLPKEAQTEIANKIVSEDTSIKDVKNLVEKKALDLKFPNPKVDKKAKAEAEAIMTFRNFYGAIKNDAMSLNDRVNELNNYTTEFKDAPYKQIKERIRVLEVLVSLQGNIAQLIVDLKQ